MTHKDYQKIVGMQFVVHSDYVLPWQPEHGKYTLYDMHTGIPYENENKVRKHYWHLARITDLYQSDDKYSLYYYNLSYEDYNICGDESWGVGKGEIETTYRASRAYNLYSYNKYYWTYEDLSVLNKKFNESPERASFIPVKTWIKYQQNKIKQLESLISSQGTIERIAI